MPKTGILALFSDAVQHRAQHGLNNNSLSKQMKTSGFSASGTVPASKSLRFPCRMITNYPLQYSRADINIPTQTR